MSRTCVSAPACARARALAVGAEPGRTNSLGADGLSPWFGRRAQGGSGSRQSPSRAAAPTLDLRSRSARWGRGGDAWAGVHARGQVRVGASARECSRARVSVCAWVWVGSRVRARALGAGSAGGAGRFGHYAPCSGLGRGRRLREEEEEEEKEAEEEEEEEAEDPRLGRLEERVRPQQERNPGRDYWRGEEQGKDQRGGEGVRGGKVWEGEPRGCALLLTRGRF